MMMLIAELSRRAYLSSDPIWLQRYQLAIRYTTMDPVNLTWLDTLSPNINYDFNSKELIPIEEIKEESWRDRAIKNPIF